jgi:hypothetical protein
MEAQESFSLWLVFKDLRLGWRGDMDERARAIQAAYLAKLPQKCLVGTTCGRREVLSARLPQGGAYWDQLRGGAVDSRAMEKHSSAGGGAEREKF